MLERWNELESLPPGVIHDEIEWVNPPDAIETGTRQGRSGFDQAESAFRRAYDSLEFEVERRVERGQDFGVVTTVLVRGRGSGIEVPQRMGLLFSFRDGKIARFEWSNDPEGLLAHLESEGSSG